MSESNLTRRSFLKMAGVVGGAAAASTAFEQLAVAAPDEEAAPSDEIQYFNGVCRSNCNFACRYTAFVKDGKILKLEPAEYEDNDYTGCCLKGLAYIERIYGPQRIKYPMKRAGERGEDQWERISWDEAFELMASKYTEIAEKYGAKSIVYDRCTGNYAALNGSTYGMYIRLGSAAGWCRPYINYDYAVGHGFDRLFGTGEWYAINEIRNVYDSNIHIIWGTNPVFTGPQMWRFIQFAREKGTKVICIDPIRTATSYKSDEYIPVTPGNDGYLANAMSNYLIQEDLIDWDFIKEKTTAAFLVRQDTKMHLRNPESEGPTEVDIERTAANSAELAAMAAEGGDFWVWDLDQKKAVPYEEATNPAYEGTFTTEDGIVVEPAFSLLKKHLAQYSLEEAERICGVPQEKIIELATEVATKGPVSAYITYGTDHYVNGHRTAHCIGTFMTLTGNYARKGAGFQGVWVKGFPLNLAGLWVGPEYQGQDLSLPQGLIHEAATTGKLEGQDYPIKAMFSAASNMMSNLGAQNNFINEIIPALEFWTVVDLEMTDSCRYADLVLPAASWYEVTDIYAPYCHPYTVLGEKAIEPLYESKADMDIAIELGRKMGFTETFPEGMTVDDWIDILLDNDIARAYGLTRESIQEKKYIRTDSAHKRAYVRGIDEPIATESGKIQLYCESPTPRVNYGQELPPIDDERLPTYREPYEASPNNPLYEKYPLVFFQEHSRFRVHSQWFNVPMLKELDPEPLAKINSVEAEKRGLKSGDIVEVYNDRGHAVCKCLVDESIAPGICSIPKGWQRDQFVAGGFQELTQPYMDPYPSVFGFYDSLVDVRKWEG